MRWVTSATRYLKSPLPAAVVDGLEPPGRVLWLKNAGALYAVGDVHGRLDLLGPIVNRIESESTGGYTVVLLGDFIDRGPESAQVVDFLLEKRAGGAILAVAGNHERMADDFLARPFRRHPWLRLGGSETLTSYGIDLENVSSDRELQLRVAAHVPAEHIEYLHSLPWALETERYFLTHEPGGRSDKINVHGHVVVSEAELTSHAMNLDTGAYATGVLSAAHLPVDGQPTSFKATSGLRSLGHLTPAN